MVDQNGRNAEEDYNDVNVSHRYSLDRPKSGRRRMPSRQPGIAAKSQIQPWSEPDATPPTKAPMLQPKPRRAPQPISNPPIPAASSDFAGGHADAANGFVAAAAAMAPNSIPKSVRLEVSESNESVSARLGPGHCQNAACERSKPSAVAAFAPQTV